MRWLPLVVLVGCSEFNLHGIGESDADEPAPAPVEDPPVEAPTEPVPGAPWLVVTPDSYAFEDICGGLLEVVVTNTGDEPAVIEDLLYRSAGGLVLQDEALRPLLPMTMPPGGEGRVTVAWAPVDSWSETGTLEIVSTDPRGVVTADQSAEFSLDGPLVETFSHTSAGAVDVILLIDQSGSMADDNIRDVEDGIPGFVDELQASTDWQLIQITENDGCHVGEIYDAHSVDVADRLTRNAFDPDIWIIDNLSEKLLELAALALSQTGPGGCNDGFLREGAKLNVMLLSDEEDQSTTGPGGWLTEYETYVGPGNTVVSAIVDVNRSCGDGSGGGGYLEAAAATGGPVLDICSPDWGEQLPGFAADLVASLQGYVLSETPLDGTVTVTVDGVPAVDFEVNGNTVVVSDPVVADGQEVEITYTAEPDCG